MKAPSYWLNSDLNVFWFLPDSDQPEYLSHTAVTNIEWGGALNGRDLIWLQAQLPAGKRILDLEDGGHLELIEIQAGPRDDYENREAIAFRALMCITQSRNVSDPVISDPRKQGIVMADVWLSCYLEVEPDE